MCPPKSSSKEPLELPTLTPSEVKGQARSFFNELLSQGKSPWPAKFLPTVGFMRKQCKFCHKNFWTCDADREDCGDSTCCGGYSFLHPENPPEHRTTYYEAWEGIKNSLGTCRKPHTAIRRYPVVARWRSDVDFVAAGIYCFQPYCVTGESDPPANPLVACQFCLRFNDLDNIGRTGRHFSGFNMIGIQVFNHADKERAQSDLYDEIEEVYWKDSCIEFNYRWVTETLHKDPKGLTFIEDVWQGGGNCGACVEYFYGGLEIGNMVFTEYSVAQIDETVDGKLQKICHFAPIDTKVIDVGIGLERIPWLMNGSWTSYLDVFDYMLPELSKTLSVPIDNREFRSFAHYTALFDVDENKEIDQTWASIKAEMSLDDAGLAKLREELNQFADLIVVCDHTRTVLFSIEDGALPSNVGGGSNIRSVLRRVFSTLTKRGWFEKIGGIEGLLKIFQMHITGLKPFTEFHNIRCLNDTIRLEYKRWTEGKSSGLQKVESLFKKKKAFEQADWFMCLDTYGVTADEVSEVIKQPVPQDLFLALSDMHCRTAKALPKDLYNVDGIPDTVEHFNEPEHERTYEWDGKIIHCFNDNAFACDETIMYATQGGQNHDEGIVAINGKDYPLETVEKVRKVVIFVTKDKLPPAGEIIGKACHQVVNKEVRETLRRMHTATHVIAAATRTVLGPHVWQNGAKKTKEYAHIDLTHFTLPTHEQIMEIDRVANMMILSGAKVTKRVYTRKEAEDHWGFVLYQGGAIPGNNIRVVDIDGIDTEACCGTHCDTLWEIGQLKINACTKVSDGVIRIEFVAGLPAIMAHHEEMEIISQCKDIYGCPKTDIVKNTQRFFTERNTFSTQARNYQAEALELAVAATIPKGEKLILRRKEDSPSIFIKAMDSFFAGKKEAAGKSMIVVGQGFFYGLVQEKQEAEFREKIEKVLKDTIPAKITKIEADIEAGKKTFEEKKAVFEKAETEENKKALVAAEKNIADKQQRITELKGTQLQKSGKAKKGFKPLACMKCPMDVLADVEKVIKELGFME